MRFLKHLLLISLFLLVGWGNAFAISVLHIGSHETSYTVADPTISPTQISGYSGQTGMDAMYFDEHGFLTGGASVADIVSLFNSGVDMVFAQPAYNSTQQSIINAILGTSLNYSTNHGGSSVGNFQPSAGQAGHPVLAGVNLGVLNENYWGISGLPGSAVEIAESIANGVTQIFSYQGTSANMVVLAFEAMEYGANADEQLIVANALNWAVSGAPETPIPEPATFFLFGIGLLGLARFNRK